MILFLAALFARWGFVVLAVAPEFVRVGICVVIAYNLYLGWRENGRGARTGNGRGCDKQDKDNNQDT